MGLAENGVYQKKSQHLAFKTGGMMMNHRFFRVLQTPNFRQSHIMGICQDDRRLALKSIAALGTSAGLSKARAVAPQSISRNEPIHDSVD
jgi:hypothetical protein